MQIRDARHDNLVKFLGIAALNFSTAPGGYVLLLNEYHVNGSVNDLNQSDVFMDKDFQSSFVLDFVEVRIQRKGHTDHEREIFLTGLGVYSFVESQFSWKPDWKKMSDRPAFYFENCSVRIYQYRKRTN